MSELLEHVRTGRVDRITRRGKAIAELRPVVEAPPERLRFGCDRGRIVMSDDFDAPVPGFKPYER